MGGRLAFSGFFKKILFKHAGRECFIVFDIGTFSVKALYIEVDRSNINGRVIMSSSRYHIGGDINIDGTFNISGISNTCRATLNELRGKLGRRARFTNNVVVGVGGGFIFGKTLLQTYIREQPHTEINEGELANIIQKIQQRNYEQIRREFKKDTGKSELDVYITSSVLQEVKVDGYLVMSPLRFKGKEISCSIFNAYIPRIYLKVFEGLINSLGLNLISIIAEPYAVFSAYIRGNPTVHDFILVDIGGSTTEIALARKGKLEDTNSISLGGASFTKSISENLKIGLWEAENIKRKFAKNEVSARVARRIEEIIMRDSELFLRGLEMILSDMSQVTLLPAKIFLYGGGSLLPFLYKLLRQKSWRDDLSFFSKPTIDALPLPGIEHNQISGENMHWAVALSIADVHIYETTKGDDIMKLLRRTLRVMQS